MNIYKILLTVLLVFTISACGGNEDASDLNSTDVEMDSRYYGSWKYAHDGSELYIISSTKLDFIEIDENQLEVNDNGTTKYLIRNGIKAVSLNGKIEDLSSSSNSSLRSVLRGSRIGGMDVVLENVRDKKIKIIMTTDNEGNFDDNTLPAGDYIISSEEDGLGFETEISIDDDIDLGNFMLVDADTNNFKTELILHDDFIYADGQTYNAIVRIYNISNIDGIGLNYTLSLTDDKLKSFTNDNVLGTLQAGAYKDIPIHFSFNTFLLNEKKIELNVKIKDVDNNEWNDVLAFKAYRTKVRLNFSSEQSNIRGYITLANNTQRNIDLSSGYIDVPTLIGEAYYIVLSNPDLSQETAYSIGYEVPPASLSSFHDTSRYEAQNFNFEGAINIEKGTNISSYLHAGDIDFYKIQMTEIAKLFENISNAAINTLYESNEIIITDDILKYGMDATVDNGSIILNGVNVGQVTSLSQGDKLKLQNMSPLTFSTTSNLLFKVGDLNSTFDLKVLAEDKIIDDFNISSVLNAMPSTEYSSDNIRISGVNTILDVSISNGVLIKNEIELTEKYTTAVNGDVLRIKQLSGSNVGDIVSTVIQIGDESKIYSITVARFIRDDINGIVKDNKTGFIWQDFYISGAIKKGTVKQAVDYCRLLELAGYQWKLASSSELYTIRDSSKINPAIQDVFENIISDKYWTTNYISADLRTRGTTNGFIWNFQPDAQFYMYYVDTFDFTIEYANINNEYNIRCIKRD